MLFCYVQRCNANYERVEGSVNYNIKTVDHRTAGSNLKNMYKRWAHDIEWWSNLPADTSCIDTSSADANVVHRDGNWDATGGRVSRWVVVEPPKDWPVDFHCSSRQRPDTAHRLQSFIDSRLDRDRLEWRLSSRTEAWRDIVNTAARIF